MGETYYHVTHRENVESIKQEGLKPSPSVNHATEYVFLTATKEGAQEVMDAYYGSGDNAVVLECNVLEYKLIDDPDPHGELDSYAHNGPIEPRDIEVL